MYKLIFTLLTDPLGLPISPIWEYVILAILNEIAFKIAWNSSPGGTWGSEIHWAVRIPTFFVIWAITYGIIWTIKWVAANWILVLSILGIAIIIVGLIAAIFITRKRSRIKTPVNIEQCIK